MEKKKRKKAHYDGAARPDGWDGKKTSGAYFDEDWAEDDYFEGEAQQDGTMTETGWLDSDAKEAGLGYEEADKGQEEEQEQDKYREWEGASNPGPCLLEKDKTGDGWVWNWPLETHGEGLLAAGTGKLETKGAEASFAETEAPESETQECETPECETQECETPECEMQKSETHEIEIEMQKSETQKCKTQKCETQKYETQKSKTQEIEMQEEEGFLDEEEEEDEELKNRYLGKRYDENAEEVDICHIGEEYAEDIEEDYIDETEEEYAESAAWGYIDEDGEENVKDANRERADETMEGCAEERRKDCLPGCERAHTVDEKKDDRAGHGQRDTEEEYLDEEEGEFEEEYDGSAEKEKEIGGKTKEESDFLYGEENDLGETYQDASEEDKESYREHCLEEKTDKKNPNSQRKKGKASPYTAVYRDKQENRKNRRARKGRQIKEYRAARQKKTLPYRIRNIDIMDHIVASAGVLILAGAIVMGTVYANAQMAAVQVASFAEVGMQMEGIAVIGESGLLAMTHAQNEKAAVAEAEAAEEAAVVKEYEEKELYAEGSISVEMRLSSVQKDLKIKFVNKETGKLISSVPFAVTVVGEDKKSYVLKDEDMDGIIYQANAVPGNCQVAMMEVEDVKEYSISTQSVAVTVKDTIEYKKVDVADEIKKESEVNAAAEDTRRNPSGESGLKDTVGFVESTKEVTEKPAGADTEKKPDGKGQGTDAAGAEKGNGAAGAEKDKGEENTASLDGNAGAAGSVQTISYEEISKDKITDPAAAFVEEGGANQAGDGADPAQPAVFLNRTEAKVLTNHTIQLSADVKGLEEKSVTWVSDNNAVATVALDGTVTGVSEGTAVIMVICNGDNNLTALCTVKVQTEPSADYNTKLSDNDGNALYVMEAEGKYREAVYADYYTVDKFYFITQTGQDNQGQEGQPSEGQDNQGQENQPPEGQPSEGQDNQSQEGQPSEGQENQGQEGQDNQGQENQPPEGQDNQGQEGQPSEGQDNQGQEGQPSEGQDNQGQEGQPSEGQDNQGQENQPSEGQPSEGQEPPPEEVRYTGWQTLDGKTYYFDANGNKVTGEQVIQGAKYTFDQDGVLSTASGHMGIDVSRWNGNIDWNAVKNSGVSYVIIRCGYRGSTTGALIEDSMFRSNIQGASSAGLKVGIYFVTQAVNEVEAVEEASMVLGMIGGYHISYPVFLDVEPSGGRGDSISRDMRTAVCRAFCQTIQNSGYTAGIYASNNWLNEKMDAPGLANFKIWMAHYAAEPSYKTTRYDLWQYSAKGKVSGISGDTDLNISYLGY